MKRRGMSLLETLLSGLLIMTVLYLLMSMYPMSFMSLRRGQSLAVAAGLAQGVLDERRQVAFDSLTDGTTTLPEVVVDGVHYTPTLTIATVHPGLKDLVATVAWDAPGRPSLTYQTSRFRFRNP